MTLSTSTRSMTLSMSTRSRMESMSIASMTSGTMRSARAWASCSTREPIGLGLIGLCPHVSFP